MDQEKEYKVVYTQLRHKDNSISDKCRVEGNEFYVNSDFHYAIIFYNMAIAYAKTNEVLSLAYENRSAAYFEAKKYRECIENIKLARECGYPTEKLRNLKEREEKCLKFIENGNKEEKDQANYVWDFFKLLYSTNKKIPWIITGLEAKKKGEYSKRVHATRYLRAGDIIAIEEIDLFQTKNEGNYMHCANCFKTNMLNLIPCLKTANYMYCSTKCRDEYYKYADDGVSQELIYNQKGVYVNKMCETFGGFEELFANMKPKSTNLFDFDFSNPKISQYDKYKCLITSYDFEYSENPNSFDYVPKCVLALDSLLSSNSLKYTKNESSCRDNDTFFSYFAFAMKSSCTRNVNYICIDNKCIFYVEKPIKAGEELFISLAGPWYMNSIEERKTNILTKDCECVACTEKLTAKDLKYIDLDHDSLMIEDYPPHDVLSMIMFAKNCFALLNRPEFNVLTSMERREAIDDIISIFQDLAYKIMFP